MQKFEVGQHVMVKDKWGVRDYPTYTEQVVLGFYRKNPGYSSYYSRHRSQEFIEDPKGNYVRVTKPTKEWDCNGCANTGHTEPRWEIIDDQYTKTDICPNCEGRGKITSSGNYNETVLNRKDYIMSMEDYAPILAARAAKVKREEEAKEAHKRLVNNLIIDLVNTIESADDKVNAAAEFIGKYAYATNANTNGSRFTYIKQSPLYEAAAKVREERRKADGSLPVG